VQNYFCKDVQHGSKAAVAASVFSSPSDMWLAPNRILADPVTPRACVGPPMCVGHRWRSNSRAFSDSDFSSFDLQPQDAVYHPCEEGFADSASAATDPSLINHH
jgi:hypothetical protein